MHSCNLETQKSRGSWFASTKRGIHPSIWRPAKASKKCCRAILKSLKVGEKKGPVEIFVRWILGVGTCTNKKKTCFGKNNHRLKAALKLEKIYNDFFLSNLEILVCKLLIPLKLQGNVPERPVTTSTVRSGLGSLEGDEMGKTV